MSMPLTANATASDPQGRLSERQRTCLALAADGLTSRRIAKRLGVSHRTVDEHLLIACRVLGVRTRVQAVARWAAASRASSEGRSWSPDP